MSRKKQTPKTRRSSVQRKKTSRLKLLNGVSFTPKRVAALVVVFAVIGAIIISQSRAGVVEDYTLAGQATKGLDPTGKTLPSFDYPVPTSGRVVYMAPDDKGGNDANDGFTLEKPVATITRAYNQLKSGGNASGTIVLRGGEYRSWYSTDGKIAGTMTNGNITFQAYRSEKPWFVGTDPVKDGWVQASSGVWKRKWATPNFCTSHLSEKDPATGTFRNYRTKVPRIDGAMVAPITSGTEADKTGISMGAPRVCAHPDTYYTRADRPFDVDTDPQLVVSGGVQLPQKKSLPELANSPNSFYYDWVNEEIYVNKDPSANTVELSKRHALTLFGGPFKFEWKGIGVKHFASSPLHAVIYAGLGGASNPNAGELIVENSVFTENSGNTIDLSGPKLGSRIKRSVFASNSYTGFGSNGFASSSEGNLTPNSLTIEASIFNDNNKGNFDTACGASCGAAAVKLNNMTGYTVKNSIFENTNGRAGGLWCDIDCSSAVMVNNVIRNNGGPGIFYEISGKGGIIANNLIYDNRTAGIQVFASDTKIYNNTIINKDGGNVEAVWIMDDNRPAPDKGESWPYTKTEEAAAVTKLCAAASRPANCTIGSPGPNTNNVEFVNNLIVGQPNPGARLNNFGNNGIPFPPNTLSKDYFRAVDYNAYYHKAGQNLYRWATTDGLKTPDQLRSFSGQPWDINAIQVTADTTPDPFVDRGRQDFRLKTTSEAYAKKGMALPADVAAAMGANPGATLSRGAQFTTTNTTPPPAPNDTTAPTGPNSLSANPASTSQINLSWPAAVDAESGIKEYAIFRNNSPLKNVSANILSFSDTGLPANTSYTYQVKAVNNVGLTSTGSPVVTAKTNSAPTTPPPAPSDTTPPSPPANLTRSLRADWTAFRYVLDLKWTAATDSSGIKEYRVQRNGKFIGKTGTNVTTFTDTTLGPDITYSYTVTAVDNAPTPNVSLPSATTAKASCFLIWCSLQ